MKRLMVALALAVLAQAAPGEEPACHQHEHKHAEQQVHLVPAQPGGVLIAQNRYFVATCSRGDLYVRFVNLGDARRCADEHARATGHATGVIKE